jgi:hypothetical protein
MPVRSIPSGRRNLFLTAPDFPHENKAYIPVPREQQYVAQTTNDEKEVITTSKKMNEAAAAKNVPANDKSAVKDSKKSA